MRPGPEPAPSWPRCAKGWARKTTAISSGSSPPGTSRWWRPPADQAPAGWPLAGDLPRRALSLARCGYGGAGLCLGQDPGDTGFSWVATADALVALAMVRRTERISPFRRSAPPAKITRFPRYFDGHAESTGHHRGRRDLSAAP